MADLTGLLRLRDWELDEKRRALGAVLAKRQSLVDRLEKLGQELGREREVAGASIEAGRIYPAFARAMIRRMGPAILRGAGQIHQQCYDLGSASASVSRRSLVLRSEGAEFMTNPTWQLLQLIGHRLLIDASGHTPLRVEGRAMAPAAFEAHVSWA